MDGRPPQPQYWKISPWLQDFLRFQQSEGKLRKILNIDKNDINTFIILDLPRDWWITG